MKITETLTPVNSEKTVLGSRDITLTYDTATDELSINAPAMFTNPVVKLSDLRDTLSKLSEHYSP